jgi:signal transduction histidine kinase
MPFRTPEIDSLIGSYAAYGFTNLYIAINGDRRNQNPDSKTGNVYSHQSLKADTRIHHQGIANGSELRYLTIFDFEKDTLSDDRSLGADSSTLEKFHRTLFGQISKLVNSISRENPVVASDLFFRDPTDSVPVCLIGCVINGGDPGSECFVILEVPATGINRIMLQDNNRIGLGESGEAYLVGGDAVMRSVSRFISKSLLQVPVNSETAAMAIQGATGASITYDYRGTRVFSAYEPLEIPGLNWIVLAEIDYQEAMIPVTGLRNDILLVSIIISLFILGFAQVITKMITQPIIRLKNAAAKLGEGNFDSKVPVGSKDEIGALAETFNTMSYQLREERKKRIQALYDGQEMERRRISRELHDGLGQKLVGAKLQIENCNDHDPACLGMTMDATKTGLHAIIEELRRISNDLMPAALHELGLETALRNLCDESGRQLGFDVDFDTDIITAPDDHCAVYLFRIVQEGIQNIIKHASATAISLQLIESRESYILILEDNGIGFNPVETKPGNGLSNMKERAGLLGGTISLESEPGKGTTIRVKIPTNEPTNQNRFSR